MARYKEIWVDIEDPTVRGYQDTEHAEGARFLPLNSPEVAAWIAEGNTADPAYTAAEIAAAGAADAAADASSFVAATSDQVASYTERKAAKMPGRINSLKFKSLQRRRAVALGRAVG